jgi:hypothetical protein
MDTLNFDVLNEIIHILGEESVYSILELMKCNRYMYDMVNHSNFWNKMGRSLNFQSPKKKAKKFKTWKDVIFKHKGKFCEMCRRSSLEETIPNVENILVFTKLEMNSSTNIFACLECRLSHVQNNTHIFENENIIGHSGNEYITQQNVIQQFCLPRTFVVNYTVPQRIYYSRLYQHYVHLYNINSIKLYAYAYHGNYNKMKERLALKISRKVKMLQKKEEEQMQRQEQVYSLLRNNSLSETYVTEFMDYIYDNKGILYLAEIFQRVVRKDLLIKELSKYQLKLRSDSILCRNYINGVSSRSLENIVEKMIEMDWFFKYTTYEYERSYLIFDGDVSYSEYGKEIAIKKWIKKVGLNKIENLQLIANSPPISLHDIVKKIFYSSTNSSTNSSNSS